MCAVRHIAYLSLQAVQQGQDTWAAVMEVISALEAEGWHIDDYFPRYRAGSAPGILRRLVEIARVQIRLIPRMGAYDALYVRGHPLAWPSALLSRLRRIPVVQECNGPYEDVFIAWPQVRLLRPMLEWMQRSQFRWASEVITVADGLTSWLKTEVGHDRITTIGNGANTEVFRPDAPRRPGLPEQFMVFFGQFARWQGIGTLLEAVRSPEWPQAVTLVFFGDGAMRSDIERCAEEMPERVVYLGGLPYEEVPTVVAHSIASFVPMLYPEREERFSPLKLYESMACGVPVIASDTRGISEIVNQWGCGVLLPPGDVTAFARAAAYLAAHPETAREMGARGRRAAVEHYSWPARARQRLAIVERAIAHDERKRQA